MNLFRVPGVNAWATEIFANATSPDHEGSLPEYAVLVVHDERIIPRSM